LSYTFQAAKRALAKKSSRAVVTSEARLLMRREAEIEACSPAALRKGEKQQVGLSCDHVDRVDPRDSLRKHPGDEMGRPVDLESVACL
jgi:hypothetical protein